MELTQVRLDVCVAVALISSDTSTSTHFLFIVQSLNFGRPPSFSLSTIDCKMPADATQFAFSNDQLNPPFHSTKYRYFSIYLSPVIDAMLGAKTANYATILALDRKVRDQDLAPLIEFDTSRAPGDPIVDLSGSNLGVTMQKFMIVAWPHLSTLLIIFCSLPPFIMLFPFPPISTVVLAPRLFRACVERASGFPGSIGKPLRPVGVGHLPQLVCHDRDVASGGTSQW